MHLFVTGETGIGKSNLIHQLVNQVPVEKIYGFYTKKISVRIGKENIEKVYMYAARQTNALDQGCCIATILGPGKFDLNLDAFEKYGVDLLDDIPDRSVVVMDELGFLESQAATFCQRVLQLLGRQVLIIGVIKAKQTEFLARVRCHVSVEMYSLTKENREALTQLLMEKFKEKQSML